MKKLLIIDGNSILNRAFYGLMGRNMLRTKDGIYTNAVFGFLNIINKYLDDQSFTHFFVAFDTRKPTFRHKEYDQYKATRSKMPDELAMQVPLIKELMDALNIERCEMEGYEADDIIGTIAKRAKNENIDVRILTGDKDSFQLIDDKIHIYYPSTSKGVTTTKEIDKDALLEMYGIKPWQVIEMKALMGDSSDNIPGIRGIGEKTAIKLLDEYGNIETLYEKVDEMKKSKRKENIINDKENCFLSKSLATIDTDVKIECEIEKFMRKKPNKDILSEFLNRLELNRFLDKFGLEKDNDTPEVDRQIIDTNTFSPIGKILYEMKSNDVIFLHYNFEKIAGTYFLSDFSLMTTNSVLIHFKEELLLKKVLTTLKENQVICVFDSKPLYGFLINNKEKIKSKVFDLSLAAYVIKPSSKHQSIEELYFDALRKQIDESDQNEQLSLLDEKPEKSDYDIRNQLMIALYELYSHLNSKLAKDLLKLYEEIELPLSIILAKMEYEGIHVDLDVLKDLDQKLESNIKKLSDTIYEIADEEFNLNSPKQLGVILFEKLKLPVIKKTKTGYSTNVEVLEMLRGRHEIIEHIMMYRQLEKLRGTYSKGLISQVDDKTQCIYTSFEQKIATTGRISSKDPNLQNIPIKLEQGREFRKAFIPKEGNCFIDADYSQIELRVLAHMAKEEAMIEAFNNDEDIHMMTAMRIFNADEEEITPMMRNRAKTVNFSVIYGISAYSLSIDLGITRKEAMKYIDTYFAKYPKIQTYMEEVKLKAKEDGFVTTMFGRIRYIEEISSSNFNVRSFGERVAMNAPIQGTAADIIKIAMIRVDDALEANNLKAKMILQVHDELMIDCPIEEKELVTKILREEMEKACKLDVKLKVDLHTGENWYETK